MTPTIPRDHRSYLFATMPSITQDSKEEIDEHGSEYSLEFDDDEAHRESSPARRSSCSSGGQWQQRFAASEVKAVKQGGSDGQLSSPSDPQIFPRQR